jgi:hypothetical protein
MECCCGSFKMIRLSIRPRMQVENLCKYSLRYDIVTIPLPMPFPYRNPSSITVSKSSLSSSRFVAGMSKSCSSQSSSKACRAAAILLFRNFSFFSSLYNAAWWHNTRAYCACPCLLSCSSKWAMTSLMSALKRS